MRKTLICLLLTFLSAISCDTSHLDMPENDTRLVVEGWIENGHAPVVVVTASIPISSDPRPMAEIRNSILRYADVSIEVDDKTYHLTSRMSDAFSVGNYYSSSEIFGETGKTYKLTVKYDDFLASAVCTIPQPPSIISVRKNGDKAELKFKNEPTKEQFYHTFLRMKGEKLFSASTKAAIRGNECADTICLEYGPYQRRDILEIKLASMQEPMYDFWNSYQPIATMTGNLSFSSSKNVQGNIDGAIGYWAGYGICTAKIAF